MRIQRFAVLGVQYTLLVAALLVTAAVSALTTMRVVLLSQEVTVPSLIGLRVPDAGPVAARQGLLLRVEGKRNDAKVPADQILAQEPLAGAALKTNRSVRVWISLGPRRLNVPAVEGTSVRAARLALEQAGVDVGRLAEVAAGADEGTVLVQRPPAGETEVLAAEGASLLVSLGPSSHDFVMPDLIGRNADDVLVALGQMGLKVTETRYRSYPGIAPGVVLRQVPPAGFRVGVRTPISFDISRPAS
jgi:serine/threonine-protein kinase